MLDGDDVTMPGDGLGLVAEHRRRFLDRSRGCEVVCEDGGVEGRLPEAPGRKHELNHFVVRLYGDIIGGS